MGTNKLGERISASPAISGDELIYRTDSHLYCIGQARSEVTEGPNDEQAEAEAEVARRGRCRIVSMIAPDGDVRGVS